MRPSPFLPRLAHAPLIRHTGALGCHRRAAERGRLFLRMIDSLHVAGFKLFRDTTLPKLGRLNLFVGENNSGKSCLLEAINLYAGQIPVSDLVQTAAGRSEE